MNTPRVLPTLCSLLRSRTVGAVGVVADPCLRAAETMLATPIFLQTITVSYK
jgi:hypothetical protein